jgi:hypothetical protein
MEYRKHEDHALLRVWLHIIWETRTDASNQPVASISRIFYPEDVNSTLHRRQVHIHQIKTASHPKAIIFIVTTAVYKVSVLFRDITVNCKIINPHAPEKCGLRVKLCGTYLTLLGAFACSRQAPIYLSFNWRETKTWRGRPTRIMKCLLMHDSV